MASNRTINQSKEMVSGFQKVKLYHWVLIMISMAVYITLYLLITRIAKGEVNVSIFNGLISMNKYTLNGIIAQGQIIAIILITLNPIRGSNWLALTLCSLAGMAAIFNMWNSGNSDPLPGVMIPITAGGISIIISSYSSRLKSQIKRVLEYSRIVEKNEKMLHTLAYYDTLTGLPNRKMIMDEIDQLTDSNKSRYKEFELVYLDLDNFKKINDTMGHKAGDEILRQIAQRWKEACHPEDIIGRVGGDEFVIIIQHTNNLIGIKCFLEKLKQTFELPILIDRKEFYISASCGITRFPEDGKNAQELFKNADIALYKAKFLGRNEFQFFNKAMQEEVSKRIQIENGLLTAIKKNELHMVYQPQYVSTTKVLRGYEALVRWNHPELGSISPSEFIPIAEETGIIIELGRWIIETVLSRFEELRKYNRKIVIVSINISVVQILESNFVEMIKGILKKTGFDSRYLELEITESVFITSPEYVTGVIRQLKAMGIRIALDDFGTGYASLNYLQMLPINILKIDKTFIDKILYGPSANQMVGPIISLSHQLGIEVVAEGVEEEVQLKYLIDHRCDYIQGYLLGKPLDELQLSHLHPLSQTG